MLQVQLSVYGDSLGKNLKELKGFIDSNLQGAPLAFLLKAYATWLHIALLLVLRVRDHYMLTDSAILWQESRVI